MASFSLDLPTAELQEAAFKIFGETPETRQSKLAELREKIQALPNHEVIDCTDHNLIRYLRGKKFNVEKAFKTIASVVTFNHDHPKWVTNLTSEEFHVFSSIVRILNIRDKHNRVVVFFKASAFIKIFTSEFIREHPCAMIRFNVYLVNRLSHNFDIQLHGMVMIGSFSDFTLWDSRTLAIIAPVNERLGFFQYISKCCAIRIGE